MAAGEVDGVADPHGEAGGVLVRAGEADALLEGRAQGELEGDAEVQAVRVSTGVPD